jgi:hypothetical protein
MGTFHRIIFKVSLTGSQGVQTPDRKVKREKDNNEIGPGRKRPRKNSTPVVIDLLSDSEANE